MTHILVPTDFSDNSKNAFEYALHAARAIKAEITIFHSYVLPTGKDFSEEKLLVELTNDLKAFREAAKELGDFSEVLVSTRIARGFAAEKILEVAGEIQASLIVMGTQGVSGLADIFFGSITQSVIEKAAQPVLAVPETAKFSGIGNIAYAAPFEHVDLDMISEIMRYADFFGATLSCVHVEKHVADNWWQSTIRDHTPQGYWTDDQLSRLKFVLVDEGNVAEGLHHYVEANETDILAMAIHKRSFLHKLFNPSLTKELAKNAYIPLLAVPTTFKDLI